MHYFITPPSGFFTRFLCTVVSAAVCAFFSSSSFAQTVPQSALSASTSAQRARDTMSEYRRQQDIKELRREYQERQKVSPKEETEAKGNMRLDEPLVKLKYLDFDKSEILSYRFLQNLKKQYEGKTVSLRDIQNIVKTVNKKYAMDGYIDASANGGIFINETKGDMNVRRFVSRNGDINMSLDAGILGVPLNEGEYHFEADNISLESRKGSIGSHGNELRLKVNDDIAGRINLKANQNIAFRKTTPTLWSDYLIAENGSVTAVLPASNAYIYNMRAPLGADIRFSDVGLISNLRVHYVDIENTTTSIPAVVNTAAVRNASEILYRQIDKQISFVDRNGVTQLRKDWIKNVLPQKVLKEDYPDKISLNEKIKNRKTKQENI